jgi:hypothetical protein
MLTPTGIYMPVGDRIVKYSLADEQGKPKKLGQAIVDFGTGAPVGNLYSDGEKIWVHGANRLYALGPKVNSDPKQSKDLDSE